MGNSNDKKEKVLNKIPTGPNLNLDTVLVTENSDSKSKSETKQTKRMNFNLDISTHKLLKNACTNEGVTMNDKIVELVTDWLDEIK